MKTTERPELKVKILRAAAVSHENISEEMDSYCAILGDPESIDDIVYEVMRLSNFEIIDNSVVKTRYGIVVWRYGIVLIKSTPEITSLIKRIVSDTNLMSVVFKAKDGNFLIAGPDIVLKKILSNARAKMKVKVTKRARGIAFIETSTVVFDVMPRFLKDIINALLGIEEEIFSILVLNVENPEEFEKIIDKGPNVYWRRIGEDKET
ncbi:MULTISPECIES: hypothetical protein [unclassified Methanopyrus]|uniref:hypothetical protein n=1 Tax=Methanopyrus sp. SNP6 TaxID=1937005 RepID=UPI0011E5F981|nr:hypothetical protein [Methanopyrus sp. SNP6]